jgi:hypothetical protein
MTAPAPTTTARTVLRLDAALDTAIALLAVAAAAGLLGAAPPWLPPPVLLALAVVLLGFAAALLWLARRPDAGALRGLGVGNGVCALAALAWAVIGAPEHLALRIAALVVALALAAVATAQLAVARRL